MFMDWGGVEGEGQRQGEGVNLGESCPLTLPLTPTLPPSKGGLGHLPGQKGQVWMVSTSPTTLRPAQCEGAPGSSLCGLRQEGGPPAMPLQVGREPLWLLLAPDPDHPRGTYQRSRSVSHIRTRGSPRAYRRLHRHRPAGRTRTHTQRARIGCIHTVHMHLCAHTQSSRWFYVRMRAHGSCHIYVYVGAPTQGAHTEARLSLNAERPSACCITRVFSGHHLNLPFGSAVPSSPARSLSPRPPSLPPGSGQQGPATVPSTRPTPPRAPRKCWGP